MTRREQAMQYFLDGYNCAQCIILTFYDVIEKHANIDVCTALRIASPFGGGMGRLREVCGSVSAVFMVLGYIEGYEKPKDYEGKKQLYEKVQLLANRYEQENGSIICRELLGLDVKREEPTPQMRTESYYKSRPCTEKIGSAAELLEEYLIETGILS